MSPPMPETFESPALVILDGISPVVSTLGMSDASTGPAKLLDSTGSPMLENVDSPAMDSTSLIVSNLGMNNASMEPVTFQDSTASPKPKTVESPETVKSPAPLASDGISPAASTSRMNAASRKVRATNPHPKAINVMKSKSSTKEVLARRALKREPPNNSQAKTSKPFMTVKTKPPHQRRRKRHIPYWKEKE